MLLAGVGTSTKSKPLEEAADSVARFASELAQLQVNWPALDASANLRDNLNQRRKQIETALPGDIRISPPASNFDPASIPALKASILLTLHPSLPLLHLAPPSQGGFPTIPFSTGEWTNPADGIRFLQSYCDDKLKDAVARSAGSKEQSAELKSKMGEHYAHYYDMWQHQLKNEALERKINDESHPPIGVDPHPPPVEPPPHEDFEGVP
jgi:hypothetical protein